MVIFKEKNKQYLKLLKFEFNDQSIKHWSGLTIDKELSWKHHIDEIATKLSKIAGTMFRARCCDFLQTPYVQCIML